MSDSALVMVAGVLNFFIGMFWYMAFGKAWMKEFNIKEDQVNKRDPGPYLIALIGSLWASYGLFLLVKHIQPKNMLELISVAIGTWLFIVVGLTAKHHAFQGKSVKGYLIDYGLDLVGVIVMCLVIW